ncbi:hypothetical protein B0H15DRAFT_778896 [Mycena belliarum]|uniref:Uncharacterized protein n=1 Tax=Mycena belliarum TaxID=1033014 RepID=A0AAD6XPY0_9AGAR|nr:hypothetical protein B0H15DRAFT_778896 [Mycena belliae]
MTRYGLPYILEDTTGALAPLAELVDIHDRLRLAVRCTPAAPTARDRGHGHTACTYTVFDTSRGAPRPPPVLAALEFGPGRGGGLEGGTVSFGVGGKAVPMQRYLTRASALASSKVRRFVGSDGQTYQWARRTQPNQEWTCTNANGYVIASYSLKAAGEPEYRGSSGCVFELAEQFGHLAPEMLASLWIMRHIAQYDLA